MSDATSRVTQEEKQMILDQFKEERTECEIWTRVMGYHRPISEFNPGKKAEHAERKHFTEVSLNFL
jgi:anaerobic ribonucleoside-triphosphate reductase